MRMALLFAAFCIAGPAWATPALTATGSGRERLDVRVVAPDGSIAWACSKEARTGEDWRDHECIAPPAWFRGPGKYVFVAAHGELGESLESTDAQTKGDEEAITWRVGRGGITMLLHSIPLLRLAQQEGAIRAVTFVNGGKAPPVWGKFTARSLALDHFENDAWKRSDKVVEAYGSDRVDAGESKEIPLDASLIQGLTPGRYRLRLRVSLSDPSESWRESGPPVRQEIEVVGEQFDLPGSKAEACLVEAKSEAQRLSGDPYRSLHPTRVGVLLLKSTGELIRIDDGSMKVVATLPANSTITTGPNPDVLLVTGPRLMISDDGGRTFSPIGTISTAPADHLVFVGDKLLRYNDRGAVEWIERNGQVRDAKVPVKASWRAASFRDELHGALVGDCSVLLETADGGATWKVNPAPWPYPHWVQWDGEGLSYFVPGKAWIRRAGQAAFEPRQNMTPPARKPDLWLSMRSEAITVMKITFDIDLFQRDAKGKELSQKFRLENPPFHVPLSFAAAENGDVYMVTSPAGVFRYRKGELKTILSSDELEKFPEKRRLQREQWQERVDAAKREEERAKAASAKP